MVSSTFPSTEHMKEGGYTAMRAGTMGVEVATDTERGQDPFLLSPLVSLVIWRSLEQYFSASVGFQGILMPFVALQI